jgi:hypothetical protein
VGYKNVAIEQTVALNSAKDEIPAPVDIKDLKEVDPTIRIIIFY